ncbi:protein decapping 5-like [Papaver somniferum]|uniref:protein decapping 5-like n=1 Tax=Papaver somniferum TaxID=3469 RepID=UPI000E6F7BF2|nr:protein decapping 5-like [Papaver somniferum]
MATPNSIITDLIQALQQHNLNNSPAPKFNFSLPFQDISNFVSFKLDNTNYLLLKHKFETIHTTTNLLRFVKGTYVCPPPKISENGAMVTNPEYLYWISMDGFVLSCLNATFTRSVSAGTLGLTTSNDKVADEDVVLHVLNGLNADFDHFVVTAQHRETPYKFSEIRSNYAGINKCTLRIFFPKKTNFRGSPGGRRNHNSNSSSSSGGHRLQGNGGYGANSQGNGGYVAHSQGNGGYGANSSSH